MKTARSRLKKPGRFEERVSSLVTVLEGSVAELAKGVREASTLIESALSRGAKILVFGNGGSAADASHFAAEFVGRYLVSDRRAWPALALTPEAAAVTAIANDYGYDRIFSRQIEALGKRGDIAIGLSTSGRSVNVLNGFDAARRKKMTLIALTGRDGLGDRKTVDLIIRVPSSFTYEIQEVHKIVLHSICEEVERNMTSGNTR